MSDKPPSTPASRRDVCPFCRARLRPQSRREIEERYVPVYTCGVVAWEDKWRGRQERTINCCEREIAALKETAVGVLAACLQWHHGELDAEAAMLAVVEAMSLKEGKDE